MTIDQMILHISDNTKETGALYIDFNEPKLLGSTVYDQLNISSDYDEVVEDFESLEDYQKCIETNVMWSVQWYPNNSVGSYDVYGSTLEKAVLQMFNICNELNKNQKEETK
jgi:hypothetical protein